MSIYYISTSYGCCLVVATNSRDAVKKAATKERVLEVREATDDDIGWVSAMGGYVPHIP